MYFRYVLGELTKKHAEEKCLGFWNPIGVDPNPGSATYCCVTIGKILQLSELWFLPL